MNLTSSQKGVLAAGLAGGTVFLRVMPHAWNFSAMTALALFAVTFFGWRLASFLLIVGTQMAGDLILAAIRSDPEYGVYQSAISVYGSLLLIGLMGYALSHRVTFFRTAPFALAASIVFYLTTNFQCWLAMDIYAKDWDGLTQCYRDAIPFFRPAVMSDLLFSMGFCGLALALANEPEPQRV